MNSLCALRFRSWPLITLLICVCWTRAQSDPIVVRHTQGTFHGFLEVRSGDGRIVASGEVEQVIHGDRVTSHTEYHFKDGSIDDETTVFSQHLAYRLISDRHIQKGPAFPHPMDVLIDAGSGQVTVRATGKDGKAEVKTEHFDLPSDLANGLVPLVLEDMRPNATQADVSMLVASPKPRLVKLAISSIGEDTYSVAGSRLKAIHYQIKIDLGGVAGVVAPIIGKAPPNIELWVVAGPAPTFVREQGPMYADGPIMTIQLASPVWPDPSKAGH